MARINEEDNEGYWKGRMEEKIDNVISKLDLYHIEVLEQRKEQSSLRSKVNWIIGVGSGAAFVLGIVITLGRMF